NSYGHNNMEDIDKFWSQIVVNQSAGTDDVRCNQSLNEFLCSALFPSCDVTMTSPCRIDCLQVLSQCQKLKPRLTNILKCQLFPENNCKGSMGSGKEQIIASYESRNPISTACFSTITEVLKNKFMQILKTIPRCYQTIDTNGQAVNIEMKKTAVHTVQVLIS